MKSISKEHMQTGPTEKPFTCEVCRSRWIWDDICRSAFSYNSHNVVTYWGETIFLIRMWTVFTRISDFKRHSNTHCREDILVKYMLLFKPTQTISLWQ